MDPDASAQQPDATADDPSAGGVRGRRDNRARWRRHLKRAAWLAFLGAWAGLGAWHVIKPLPPGTRLATPWQDIPADSVRLLVDLTTADAFGQPVVQQQIFDESLRLVAEARQFVVLDQFLFNDQRGALAAAPTAPADAAPGIERGAGLLPVVETSGAPLRALSGELTAALVAAKRARPALRILFVTDPINDVYGGAPSPELARLEAAGIEVVRTDLDSLRDSNPAWSGLWRLTMNWWDGDARGQGWLPNPLETGPSRVTFRAWARLLNFKANHRKVLIADDGGGRGALVGIVGSANPHDASSAHSNLALALRGEALRSLLRSELEVARFSGWRGGALPGDPGVAGVAGGDLLAAGTAGPGAMVASGTGRGTATATRGDTLRVRVLTEGAIRDALFERVAGADRGDRIDIAMFYLAERTLVEALLAAAERGVEVRLLLDPNKDAFGRQKSGIPNRPVASELVSRSDGAIRVRWYRTHGEQFHTKLVMVRGAERLWLTLGSANLSRRNVGDFNLEANLAIEAPLDAALSQQLERYYETLWNNRAPAGIEYSADFGTFADPAQASYWAYRMLEASGFATF
jgi:phosphatidylserine/phosphatidylglycerophosphate/cardiolipin synthase-like enzyme